MAGLVALRKPIVVSAVVALVALTPLHGLLGWHKGDMTAVPGEAKGREMLRELNVQPGDSPFPHGTTTAGMTTPEFEAKREQGAAGILTICPNGEIGMRRMHGPRFACLPFIGAIAALVTGATFAPSHLAPRATGRVALLTSAP